MKFSDLIFNESIKRSLSELKYATATPVQEQTIPLMITGHNVICKSHTGSGKTLAFGIPLSDRLLTRKSGGVLILGPTRELVVQVKEEIGKLNRHTGLRVYSVYGGHGIGDEIGALKRGVNILAATPGRLLDHFKRRSLNPRIFDTVVLDEADRMLDMGFIDDIKKILEMVKPSSVHLFSATLDGKVAKLIHQYIPQYKEVILEEEIVGKNILEKHVQLRSSEKLSELMKILQMAGKSRVLVFVSTKNYVDMLTEKLISEGVSVMGIHGDKSQKYRELALDDFKKNKAQVLVATDVAARGLQIDDIEFVVNYDVARDADTHKHRIGRTGRMGKTGYAITFVSDEDGLPKSRGRSGSRRPQRSFSSSRNKPFNRNRDGSNRSDDDRGPRKPFNRSGSRSSEGSRDRDRSSFSSRSDSRRSDDRSSSSMGRKPFTRGFRRDSRR